jgi:anionic cell wall polymer biosynthesis LytR-Cps2A-Psr (LCP) family protein
MDGKRALIFARSRHAAGEEGTDFARSARQQKIIQAPSLQLMSPFNQMKPSKSSASKPVFGHSRLTKFTIGNIRTNQNV